ncbi:hypothetical protein ABH897_004480 [Paenibacillus sp. RC73]
MSYTSSTLFYDEVEVADVISTPEETPRAVCDSCGKVHPPKYAEPTLCNTPNAGAADRKEQNCHAMS